MYSKTTFLRASYNFGIMAFLFFSSNLARAQFNQVLLSESWTGTGGEGAVFYHNVTKTDPQRNVYVAGATMAGINNSDIIVQKFNQYGALLWQQTYAGTAGMSDAAADIYIDGSYNVYVTGTVVNSVADDQDIAVLKYNSSGVLQWTYFHHGSNVNVQDAGTAITSDNSTYLFVTGTSGDDSDLFDYKTISLKMSDGSEQWVSKYDYAGLAEAPKKITYKTGTVTVVGASQENMSPIKWEMATVSYNATTGVQTGAVRSNSNTVTGIEEINDVTMDDNGFMYLVGALDNSTTGYDIAVYKLDDSLNLVWENYYDINGYDDKGYGIKTDASGNIYVAGYSTSTVAGKETAVLKINSSGTLLWNHEIGGLMQSDDSGRQLVLGDNRIYVAATVNDNGSGDYKLYAFDTDGELITTAKYAGANGLNDIPQAIAIDLDGNIIVTGKEQVNTTTYQNKTVKYTLFEKTFDPVVVNGAPLYNKDELTIRFNKNLINTATIDKRNLLAGELQDFVDAGTISILNSKLGFSCARLKTFKIFKRMTTADSISVTRLGDTIKIDPFWATLSVMMPANSDLEEIIDSLNTIKNYVLYAEVNHFGTFEDVPNDFEFVYFEQTGLKGNFLGIEMTSLNSMAQPIDQGAWEYETGKPDIKVGVFDTGVNWRHEDLGNGTPDSTRVKGGWDFINGVHPYDQVTPDPGNHGTPVAGVIGAIRNNEIGVAGIAGGDAENDLEGVSLYSMRILLAIGEDDLFDVNTISDAIVEGATSYNPTTEYGFGLHLHNHSWRMAGNHPYFDTVFHLVRNAINYANRNDVVQAFASGNVQHPFESGDTLFFPASVRDTWVLKVGASCSDGWRCNFSAYNYSLDFVAPGGNNLAYTLNANSANNLYGPFNGTSAATPHATGVGALLLSKHNPTYNVAYSNGLTQEDVEYLLQKTAKPKNEDWDWDESLNGFLPVPNQFNGYGLLNAYQGLIKSSIPYRVRHFEHVYSTDAPELYADSQNIVFPEGIDGIPTDATIGLTSIYKITHTFDHTIPSNEDYLDGWVRNSTSELYGLTDSIFNTHWSAATLDSSSATQATMTGYYYVTEITLSDNSTIYKVFPEPASGGNYKYAYSIYTFDNDYNAGMENMDGDDGISIYPNPSNENVTVKVQAGSSYELHIFDIAGKAVSFVSNIGENGNETVVDVSDYPNGLYFFVFSNDMQTSVKKVVKN